MNLLSEIYRGLINLSFYILWNITKRPRSQIIKLFTIVDFFLHLMPDVLLLSSFSFCILFFYLLHGYLYDDVINDFTEQTFFFKGPRSSVSTQELIQILLRTCIYSVSLVPSLHYHIHIAYLIESLYKIKTLETSLDAQKPSFFKGNSKSCYNSCTKMLKSGIRFCETNLLPSLPSLSGCIVFKSDWNQCFIGRQQIFCDRGVPAKLVVEVRCESVGSEPKIWKRRGPPKVQSTFHPFRIRDLSKHGQTKRMLFVRVGCLLINLPKLN